MHIMGIPISDIISLAVGIIGLLSAWAMRSNRLPKAVRKYLADIGGEDRVFSLIETAAAYVDMTPELKRIKVVETLQDISVGKLGFRLPTSIANLIVEYCYQAYKRART